MNHTTQPTLELLPNPMAAASARETPPAPAHTEASPGLKVRVSVRAGGLGGTPAKTMDGAN